MIQGALMRPFFFDDIVVNRESSIVNRQSSIVNRE
jgi:hypothetical protein